MQPFLLMALDDYFSDPSQDCLARLFDAVNSMDLSGAPMLTRHEKMVMRSSERKDIFAERFSQLQQNWNGNHVIIPKSVQQHRSTNSGESYSSFEEGILMRNRDRDGQGQDENQARRRDRARERTDTDASVSMPTQHLDQGRSRNSPSDSSFSLGGSAVWVGDESGLDLKGSAGDSSSVSSVAGNNTLPTSFRRRRSTDGSSSSSQVHGREQNYRPIGTVQSSYFDSHSRPGMVKDTHFYHTSVAYKDHHLPINMPLATFPEEVGDVRQSIPLETAILIRVSIL